MIPVEINKEKFHLILDLGAEDSSLNKKIIDKLHLLSTNRFKETSNIYGTKINSEYYLVNTLKIGNSRVNHTEIRENPKIDSSSKVSLPQEFTYGIIGRSFFYDKFLFLDYKNKKMHFGPAKNNLVMDPEQYKKGEWIQSDFCKNEGSEIIVEIVMNGVLRKFVIDTASNFCILTNNSLESSSYHAPIALPVQLKNGYELGTFDFTLIQNSDFDLDGILGSELFNRYIVGFDFLNKKMFLLKY
ncbi:MAG TPA: aspartyl protease family protein [Candidatus Rhabdochlamydia sp.]|nr:aspartyl protease family protein [Candidatus Rhabdochlamydia sp.]